MKTSGAAQFATALLALTASAANAANFPDPPKSDAMAQPGKATVVLAGLALDMSGSKIPFEAFASQDRNFEFTVAGTARQ